MGSQAPHLKRTPRKSVRPQGGGPPRVHGRYSEEPRTPVEQAPAPWAKAAADEEAAREGISREDIVSEGPWTGANSTPRLGGYTSARVTPDVMASDAETNATWWFPEYINPLVQS